MVEIDKELYRRRFNEAYHQVKKRDKVWEKITRLNIAITNRCNADCVFCYRPELDAITKPMHLPYEDACTFINRATEQLPIKRVNFGMTSEPTLHPQLPAIVAHAAQQGLETRISTNLQLLTPDLSKRLLDAGLNRACFSIDEAEKTRFEALRRGLNWEKVLYHAYTFKKIRDQGGYKCKIYVNPVHCRENKGREEIITEFWGKVSDTEPVMCREIPTGTDFRVQPWFDPYERSICTDTFAVYTNGDVGPCCFDTFNRFPLGNMYRHSVEEILGGEQVRELRRRLYELDDMPFHCRVCVSLPRHAGRELGI